MAETTLPASVARTPENLSIKTAEELEDFWRTILLDFVKIVDPENSGFLEDLFSDQLLTHADYESMVSGKDYMPRAKKARKLWLVLASYNLGLFRAKVARRLLESFAPIIPDRFFTTSDHCLVTTGTQSQCLRHAIQIRIRVDTMTDLLCHHGCLSLKDYGTIVSSTSRNSTADWKIVFKAFAGKASGVTDKLVAEVQELLECYNVPFPDNMADFLVRGFPCTCDCPEPSPPDDVESRDTQVMSWLERKLTTLAQHSPDSSLTRVDGSPDSTSLSSTFRPVSELDAVFFASNTDLSEEINTQAENWVRLGTDSSAHHGSILPSTCIVETPHSTEEAHFNVSVDKLVIADNSQVEEKVALLGNSLTQQPSRTTMICTHEHPPAEPKYQNLHDIQLDYMETTVLSMDTMAWTSSFEEVCPCCDDDHCSYLCIPFLSSSTPRLVTCLGPVRIFACFFIVRIALMLVILLIPIGVFARFLNMPLTSLEGIGLAVLMASAYFVLFLIAIIVPLTFSAVLGIYIVKSLLSLWKNKVKGNKKRH